MLRGAVANVQEGFRGVQPEDAQSSVGLVSQQQRHGPVQAPAAVQVVGEGVQVIKTIGFPESVGAAWLRNQHPTGENAAEWKRVRTGGPGVSELQVIGVLRDAVHVTEAVKAEVCPDAAGTCRGPQALRPPASQCRLRRF